LRGKRIARFDRRPMPPGTANDRATPTRDSMTIEGLDKAPYCAAADPRPHEPQLLLMPDFACDCHAHVFGPVEQYPYAAERMYTPPDALPRQYRRMLDKLGVGRAVLVQPSAYGTDNSAMLDALAADPERLRGVAVAADDISDAELESMNAAGVRGLRCNVVDIREGKARLPFKKLRELAERIEVFGWHLEFLMHVDEYPVLDRDLDGFPVDLVFAHMGFMRAERGVDNAGFRSLLTLVDHGRAWVKLSAPYRVTTSALPYPEVVPFARALVDAAPDRVLWGTDWPHVMLKGKMPNDGDLADLLQQWVPNGELRRRVLVANPAKLYGFPEILPSESDADPSAPTEEPAE
jgi:predicted TIM-barrel fold metal-dependent hydrolase